MWPLSAQVVHLLLDQRPSYARADPDVQDTLAASKDLVEAAHVIQIGGVQCQATAHVRRHGLEKLRLGVISSIAHAGTNAVAPLQKLDDAPTTDKAGSACYRDSGASRDGRCRCSFYV